MKKSLITILFFVAFNIVNAQDTVYYDLQENEVATLELAVFTHILTYNEKDSNKVDVKEYYKSGKIKSEKKYSFYSKKTMNGIRKD